MWPGLALSMQEAGYSGLEHVSAFELVVKPGGVLLLAVLAVIGAVLLFRRRRGRAD